MIRVVAGVILGYVALAFFIFATFTILFVITGPSFAWSPGTTEASMSWMSGAIILSFIAALIGGWVAAKLGRSRSAVYALAALVIVLGVVNALMVSGAARPLPEGRTMESLTVMEAARYTTQPDWYNYLVPLIGAIGVLLGGNAAARPGRVQAAVPSV